MKLKNIKEIKNSKGEILALITREKLDNKGVNFITNAKLPFQMAVSNYLPKTKIPPHVHVTKRIMVNQSLEMIHIDQGKAIFTIFDEKRKPIKKVVLNSGDTILLIAGGHSIRYTKKTKIIEIKQGPYFGKGNDKIIFEA
ncbi:MAG: hypothetical protein ABSE91_00775 [Patescibacteria group bacterium]